MWSPHGIYRSPPDRLPPALGAGPDGSRRQFLPGLSGSIIPWLLYRLSSPCLPPERKSTMQFPAPRIRHFVSLSVLLFLHWKAPSCWPLFECLPHQVQKNAYHFDKVLISEPLSKLSTGPSRQSLYMKIDSHSCAFFLVVTRIIHRPHEKG